MKLSHSAIEKYRTCPQMYKLHYIDKIRSNFLGSALLFGNAMDEALNVVLLQKKIDRSEAEEKLMKEDPLKVFDFHMTMRVMNKEIGPEDIRTSQLIQYFGGDFEPGVLLAEDWEKLEIYIENAGYEEKDPEVLYEALKEKIKEGDAELTDQCYFNYASWLSMRRKGHLMIETYQNEILPQIEKVHSIQRKLSLPNDNGDEIIGFLDVELEFVDKEGIFVTDNKTASKPYKEDAINDIEEKGQLLLYDEFAGHGQGAYIVMVKKPKLIKHKKCQKCGHESTGREKTCKVSDKALLTNPPKPVRCGGDFEIEVEPQIKYQILTGTIDEAKKDLLFERINDILDKIENKEFQQNRDNCFQYGRKCPYYDHCRTGDMKNLSRVGKK
jgi:hypothetical protein